jgi:hypothetical protein
MKPAWRRPLLLAVLLVALAPRSAHAYLDPGAGSMILQLVLGGLAGLAVGLRLVWRRLAGRFSRRESAVDGDSSIADPAKGSEKPGA